MLFRRKSDESGTASPLTSAACAGQSLKRRRKLGKPLAQIQQATACIAKCVRNLRRRRPSGVDCSGVRRNGCLACRWCTMWACLLSICYGIHNFVAFLHQRRPSDNVDFLGDRRCAAAKQSGSCLMGRNKSVCCWQRISHESGSWSRCGAILSPTSRTNCTPPADGDYRLFETMLDSDNPALRPVATDSCTGCGSNRAGCCISSQIYCWFDLEPARSARPPVQACQRPALLAVIVDNAIALSDEQARPISVIAVLSCRLLAARRNYATLPLIWCSTQCVILPRPGRQIEIRWFADNSGSHLAIE